MKLSLPFLQELQNRLKVGNRLSTHLNALPKKSGYKLDFNILSVIDENIPSEFLEKLLTKAKFNFEISWKDKEIDLFNLSTGEQKKFTTISKTFTNLFNQVNVIKQEKGVETFGFGFPLLIRKDRKDKKLTVAPLIIWKLTLQRSKKNDSWIIIKDEDATIYLNEVLINHLQADSEILLDPLSAEMLEDGIISRQELLKVCKDVLIATNISKIADIDQKLDEIFSTITSIPTEEHCENLALNDTNSILSCSGLFSYFEIQKHSIIKDYEELLKLAGTEIVQDPLEDNIFQSVTSIKTDPSQQSFLNSLATVRNTVIQGPPGTGKSQTLTALLINALENGKKSIVVCEKHTALDVLQKSLEKVGLSNHTAMIVDASKARQSIVSSLRNKIPHLRQLANASPNAPFRYKASLNLINKIIEEINVQHESIGQELLAKYNWTHIVGKYLQNHRHSGNDSLKIRSVAPFKFDYEEYIHWREILQNGQEIYRDYLENGKITIINKEKYLSTNSYKFIADLTEILDSYEEKLENLSFLKNSLFEQFVRDRNQTVFAQKDSIESSIKNLRASKLELPALLQNLKDEYIAKERNDFDLDISRFSNLVHKLYDVAIRNQNNQDFLDENKQKSIFYKIGSVFSQEKKQTLADTKFFNEGFRTLVNSVASSPNFEPFDNSTELQTNLNSLYAFKRIFDSKIAEFNRNAEQNFNSLDLNYLLTFNSSASIAEHIDLLKQRKFLSTNQHNILDSLSVSINNFFSDRCIKWADVKQKLDNAPDFNFDFSYDASHLDIETSLCRIEKRLAIVVESITTTVEYEFLNGDILKDKHLFSHLESYQDLQDKLNSLSSSIASDNYLHNFQPSANLNAYVEYVSQRLKEVKEINAKYPNAFTSAYKWFNFFEKRSKEEQEIFKQILNEENWEYYFLSYYFDRLLKEKASDTLPTEESQLKKYIKSSNDFSASQIENINNIWYGRQQNTVKLFNSKSPDFQVNNLFNLRGSAGNRRYSLRYIIEKDIDLFTELNPIILTTPDVASNLFHNKNGYFDFVVFDEASQLRLEDNLPAILKGKQIIIAGDEHQMPPSSFFDKKLIAGELDSEEDDEEQQFANKDKTSVESALLSSISLLDAVTELNFQNKHLNFHYRSQHPYLIDFSNYAFYAQKLVSLPISSHYTPITYVNVHGVYESNTNEKEAETVLSILKNNIHKNSVGKYPSVGIATFNIKQRDLIQTKILQIKQVGKDKDFIKKLDEFEKDGMFIKNLENIQGDERDIIIMSTTYGTTSEGRFTRMFGQLNNQKGYKLLNVIVTRAKYKNYIITSIPEDHILNYKSDLATAGTNHGKAPLMAYLAYAKAVSEKDDNARISVLQALAHNNPASSDSISSQEDKLESYFEEEVYNRLLETEFKDFIKLQHKIGGFRIDMIIDFKISGIPVIAIECDGAKFHSSNEAYLYDFHRQKILESHGFKFHRIWSTNWWRNPEYELQKLIDFINEVRSPKPIDMFAQGSDSEKPFTDDIIVETDDDNSPEVEPQLPQESIDSLFPEEDIILKEESKSVVEINSTVKVKYNNKAEVYVFKIVSPQTMSTNQKSGIREVLFTQPLAKSIMGKSIGDIASIEGVDNFVEILGIE